jgi:hypothetical protein
MKATAKKIENKGNTVTITIETVLQSLTSETKDAVQAMNRVATSRVKEKPYRLPTFKYIGCDS